MTPEALTQEKEGEFKTDIKNIVHIFAKSLYPRDDMFIRELLQNAQDSIVKRQVQEPLHPGRIDIIADGKSNVLVIRDDGIGMTEQEILDYLCTIGGSGTREFRKSILERDRESAESLIGQFGIGMLSAFVAAEKIVIDTRSFHAAPEEGIYWWVMPGEKYHYRPVHRPTPGSTVMVYLKTEYRRLANTSRLKEAIVKYADFIPIPIFVNGEGPVNSIDPPWHREFKNEQEEKRYYLDWLADRVPDIPIEIIPVNITSPHPVKGVLYISDRRLPDVHTSGLLDIYQKRLFVCEENRTLLPPWAQFVRGIIDSPALNLTAARDAVQIDTVHDEIRESLGLLIIDSLLKLSRDDPVRFRRILQWHHYQIKEMAIRFDEFFDAIADSVIFEVSIPDTTGKGQAFRMMSIPEYLEYQQEPDENNRRHIYYISERGAAAQFYRLCQAKNIIAVNAGMYHDQEFLMKYADLHPDDIVLEQIDIAAGTVIFDPLEDSERTEYLELEHHVRNIVLDTFPDQDLTVITERFEPSGLPAVLTTIKDMELSKRLKFLVSHPGITSEAFRELFMDYIGWENPHIEPAVLHLNADNYLVQSIRREDFSDPLIQDLLLTFYQNAYLYSQKTLTPDYLEVMYNQTLKTLTHVVHLRRQIRDGAGMVSP